MTRFWVYGGTFVVTSAATAMTIASVAIPAWITYVGKSGLVSDRIGLHRRCMLVDSVEICSDFPPPPDDTDTESSSFRSLWLTTGFLMTLAIVVELVALVGCVIIVALGKQKRERGWRLLSGNLGLVAAIQFVAMGIVAYLYHHNDMFHVPGYELDTSWYLCTVSATLAVLAACGLVYSAFALPPEDGYEFLNDVPGA